jgi:hypothetical protein
VGNPCHNKGMDSGINDRRDHREINDKLNDDASFRIQCILRHRQA